MWLFLSHYIYHFMPALLVMWRIILHSDHENPGYDSDFRAEGERLQAADKYPTRLGKFPPSYSCMCDKGFARCQLCYPNMCPHECPYFLGGGKQFLEAELLYDMCIKQLWCKDERVFACLTDEKFLGSVIPSHRVEYAEAVRNWGLARNNLNAPMFKPKD